METQKCTICRNDLPKTEEFFASRKGVVRKRFQGICRKCQKEIRKRHYNLNRRKYIKKAKEYKREIIDWFTEFKTHLSCEKCGEARPWVLDFHHKDPTKKKFNIGMMVGNSSKKKISEEIEKCNVLCANCHRDLHYQEKLQHTHK